MGIDIIGVLIYAVVIKFFGSTELSIKFSALTASILPFIINEAIQYIELAIYGKPFSDLVSLADLVTLIGQIVLAFLIFSLLRRNDDKLGAWLVIVSIGGMLIYAVLPSLTPLFVSY